MKTIFLLLAACCAVLSEKWEPQQQAQCFVPGECVDSFSIEIESTADELECLGLCKDTDSCQWFTYFPDFRMCQLFSNCNNIDVEACNNCLSGQSICELADPKCWIPGECEGNSIIAFEAESEIECLRLCKDEIECKWFTYFLPGSACVLFSECETFDETSEECISGERRCKEEEETTTPTTSTSTSSTTTTVPTTTVTTTTVTTTTTTSELPAYSKILIALGTDILPMVDVEIIDLLSSETTCKKPANFPLGDTRVGSGLWFNEKPLICGGEKGRSSCYSYEDGAWKESNSLKQGRYTFAMTNSPFRDGRSILFLTGGYDGRALDSTEVLTKNGWEYSIALPVTVDMHCMVTVNSTTVMVIGGFQNGMLSGNSFLFNSEKNSWLEGPKLSTARLHHSCGLVNKNSKLQEKSLIVVGGSADRVTLRSVEVLDFDSTVWRRGPDLPFTISNAAMVEDPFGRVVLIGGYNDDTKYLDTLLILSHAGANATWELMPQKLKTARFWHTAILVPDDLAVCN